MRAKRSACWWRLGSAIRRVATATAWSLAMPLQRFASTSRRWRPGPRSRARERAARAADSIRSPRRARADAWSGRAPPYAGKVATFYRRKSQLTSTMLSIRHEPTWDEPSLSESGSEFRRCNDILLSIDIRQLWGRRLVSPPFPRSSLAVLDNTSASIEAVKEKPLTRLTVLAGDDGPFQKQVLGQILTVRRRSK